MKFSFFVALRYLLKKKTNNVINLITWIAVAVVTVVAGALIVVLSGMNGMNELVYSIYKDFDPDIRITPASGKTLNSELVQQQISNLDQIKVIVPIYEEVTLIRNKDKQEFATLKGMGKGFVQLNRLSEHIDEGEYLLHENGAHFAVLGSGLTYKLGVSIGESYLQCYLPQKGRGKSFNPEADFNRMTIMSAGSFLLNEHFSQKYILTDIRFVQELAGVKSEEATCVELALQKESSPKKIQAQLQEILGPDYLVKTRYELNEFLFRSVKAEKWMGLLIFVFILVIAVFNIIGVLTMMAIEKKADLFILNGMGASHRQLKQVFWLVGVLISFIGCLIGMTIGLLICWGQSQFEWIKIGNYEFSTPFPISIYWEDCLVVPLIILITGAIASLIPAAKLTISRRFSHY